MTDQRDHAGGPAPALLFAYGTLGPADVEDQLRRWGFDDTAARRALRDALAIDEPEAREAG